jgi:hypothetical protein
MFRRGGGEEVCVYSVLDYPWVLARRNAWCLFFLRIRRLQIWKLYANEERVVLHNVFAVSCRYSRVDKTQPSTI